MAKLNKPKLLISGDSYMAYHGNREDNPEEFDEKNKIHWAKQLEPYFDIENVAVPGTTNAAIAFRMAKAIKKQKPDYVVLGFTEFTRLEYGDYITNVYPRIINDKSAVNAWHQYIKYADENYMLYKSIIAAEYAITLARSVAKTCFATNLFSELNANQISFVNTNYNMVNLLTENLSMQLSGYMDKEIGNPKHPDWRTYHVADPEVHKNFAKCILDTFGIDTDNKEVVN